MTEERRERDRVPGARQPTHCEHSFISPSNCFTLSQILGRVFYINRGLSIPRPSGRQIYLSWRPHTSKSMYFCVLETTYWSPERRNFSANLLKLALEETNIWSPVRNFAAMTGAASRTDWMPGSRLAVWPSLQVTTDLQAAPAARQSCQLLTSWKPWRAGDPPGCRCGSGEGPTRVGNCWRYMGFSVLK